MNHRRVLVLADSCYSPCLHSPTLQMIKSGMPVAVFLTGTLLGTERFRWVMQVGCVIIGSLWQLTMADACPRHF